MSRRHLKIALAAAPLLLWAGLAATSCSNESPGKRVQGVHLADLPDCTEGFCADLATACQRVGTLCAKLYSLNDTSIPTWCTGWVKVTGEAVRKHAASDPAAAARAIKDCVQSAPLCTEANVCAGLTLFPSGAAEPGLKSEPYPPEDYNPPEPLPAGGFPKPEHPEPDQGGSTTPDQPDTCLACAMGDCPINDKVCFAVDLPADPSPGKHLGNIKQCSDYRDCLKNCADGNKTSWAGFYLCADASCRTPFSTGKKHDFSGVQACATAKCAACAPNVQFPSDKKKP